MEEGFIVVWLSPHRRRLLYQLDPAVVRRLNENRHRPFVRRTGIEVTFVWTITQHDYIAMTEVFFNELRDAQLELLVSLLDGPEPTFFVFAEV